MRRGIKDRFSFIETSPLFGAQSTFCMHKKSCTRSFVAYFEERDYPALYYLGDIGSITERAPEHGFEKDVGHYD
jgi:hypothetical protein